MVVTEQPNLKREETTRHWNPTELLIDYLKETKRWRSAEVANRIDQMFEGAFLEDFDEESGSFNEFYWTHFIKCPGKIRSRKEFNTRGLLADACADRWLLKEISQLKPKLIVSFGSKVSTWILPKIDYREKWTEQIWEEFRWIIERRSVPYANIGGLKAKLIVALHPSGANPLAITFNEKIGNLVKATFDTL